MFLPQTNVRVLASVECDPTGANQLSFSSRSAETNYYIGKTKYFYGTCRVEGTEQFSGRIYLPGTPDMYYDCNYIMWSNPQFSDKYFYAYLGDVSPMGSNVCVATYRMDNFRTWYWEWSLGPCLVAREHVSSDGKGEWLLHENIECGEYQLASSGTNSIDLLEEAGVDMAPKLVVVYTYSPAAEGESDVYEVSALSQAGESITYKFGGLKPVFAGGYLESGIYQGSKFLAFDMGDETGTQTVEQQVNAVNAYIRLLVGQGQIEKIQQMFMAPGWLVSHALAVPVNTTGPVSSEVSLASTPSSFGGYTPHNNKLFNQQFNYMVLSNNMGSVVEFGYEYFSGLPKFSVYGALSTTPEMEIYPVNYKNSDGDNTQYGITLSGFPNASFSYSQFNNNFNANRWQNGVQGAGQVVDLLGGIADVATSVAMGDVAGAVRSAINPALEAANQVAEYHDKRRVPNTLAGSATGNIKWSMGRMTYTLYKMQISERFARRADKYFDLYGYRVDEYKQPNLTGRASWNYLQLIDPVILGNLPVNAKDDIYRIFSSGVRVWHSPDVWMNYNADNRIV